MAHAAEPLENRIENGPAGPAGGVGDEADAASVALRRLIVKLRHLGCRGYLPCPSSDPALFLLARRRSGREIAD
jgi:hypothetical protein